jgi:catecholate siderophore receptor
MTNYKAPQSLRLSGAAVFGVAAVWTGSALAAGASEDADLDRTVSPITVTAPVKLEHPHQDPVAPYKSDSSASSLFTEPLLDVSKSVVILSNQIISDSGSTTFRDLMRTQPGVTLGTGEGGNAFGDRIFIRGFDARNDVYIDGIRDPGVGSRETFAVEQVEILKGPSSAFGGRGTTGGAVSLVSKSAAMADFGDMEATLGTDDTRRVSLDLNRVVSDDLAVRVNLMANHNGVAGRDYTENDRWGAALSVLYVPNDAWTLKADYFHLTSEGIPDWGVPYDLANNRPFKVRRENYYGITQRDFSNTWADVYTLRSDYHLAENLNWRTVIRYGQSLNAYTASAPERPDATARTLFANAKRRDAVTEYGVGQSDLTWRVTFAGLDHAIVGGVEVSSEAVLNRGRAFTECATNPCTGATGNPVQNLDRPDPTRAWASIDGGITSRTRTSVNTTGLYLLDTVDLSSKWQVFGGVRFDRYEIQLRQLTLATGVLVERKNSSEFTNWHFGTVFKPRANGSIYLSFASSSNPSGEQLDSVSLDYGGLDPRTVNLDPEENRAIELGTKWNLINEHLNVTAALFEVTKTNARVAVGAGAGASVVMQGEQVVRGAEVTASGNLTPKWSVFGGVTALNTEITSSPVATQVGAKFPNIPEISASVTSRYQITDKLHLGGTAIYSGEKFGGTVAALTTRVPDYWRFDLFGGYQLTERLGVSFNVLNVTDKVYYDALYRSSTPFTYMAPGRSASISFDYDF